MKKRKYVTEDKLTRFINKLIKSGRNITHITRNGQPGDKKYFWVSWVEPTELAV